MWAVCRVGGGLTLKGAGCGGPQETPQCSRSASFTCTDIQESSPQVSPVSPHHSEIGVPLLKANNPTPTPYPCADPSPTPSCWLASLRASLAHGLLFAQSHKETLLPQTQSIHIRCACECVREEGMAGVLVLTTSRHPTKDHSRAG